MRAMILLPPFLLQKLIFMMDLQNWILINYIAPYQKLSGLIVVFLAAEVGLRGLYVIRL